MLLADNMVGKGSSTCPMDENTEGTGNQTVSCVPAQTNTLCVTDSASLPCAPQQYHVRCPLLYAHGYHGGKTFASLPESSTSRGLGALELQGAVAHATERVIPLHDGTEQAPVRSAGRRGGTLRAFSFICSRARFIASVCFFCRAISPVQIKHNKIAGNPSTGRTVLAHRHTRVVKGPTAACAPGYPRGAHAMGQSQPKPALIDLPPRRASPSAA